MLGEVLSGDLRNRPEGASDGVLVAASVGSMSGEKSALKND